VSGTLLHVPWIATPQVAVANLAPSAAQSLVAPTATTKSVV
jgi:hypothetical protein